MKVLQFGQGNFLRTFADVYFETLNQEGLDYQVYVATAIPHENLEAFRRQGNRYHVVLRGSQGEMCIRDRYNVSPLSVHSSHGRQMKNLKNSRFEALLKTGTTCHP